MHWTSALWTPTLPDLSYLAMSVVRELRRRLRADPARSSFEPCLPRLAKEPPAGTGWIHEIKHDGFRIIARRDAAGVRLITRNGYNFADRVPLIVEAIAALPASSCVVDGEAIAVDENGLSVFDLIRYRRQDHAVTLCAFDRTRRRGFAANADRSAQGHAQGPSTSHPCRRRLQSTLRGCRQERLPARLFARLRRCRVKAARLAISRRPRRSLAQSQESGRAGSEARG
jgi:hypothetical protein